LAVIVVMLIAIAADTALRVPRRAAAAIAAGAGVPAQVNDRSGGVVAVR
jgi:hypothetical protein